MHGNENYDVVTGGNPIFMTRERGLSLHGG